MRSTEEAPGLGDLISSALGTIGITEGRVSRWLGRPCGCEERRQKLNSLSAWARRVLKGRKEDASLHLERMIDDD